MGRGISYWYQRHDRDKATSSAMNLGWTFRRWCGRIWFQLSCSTGAFTTIWGGILKLLTKRKWTAYFKYSSIRSQSNSDPLKCLEDGRGSIQIPGNGEREANSKILYECVHVFGWETITSRYSLGPLEVIQFKTDCSFSWGKIYSYSLIYQETIQM